MIYWPALVTELLGRQIGTFRLGLFIELIGKHNLLFTELRGAKGRL